MSLSHIDLNIVRNIRRDHGEAIAMFSDEVIDKAWRWYSQSEDYDTRHEKPELFLLWVEMVNAEA